MVKTICEKLSDMNVIEKTLGKWKYLGFKDGYHQLETKNAVLKKKMMIH